MTWTWLRCVMGAAIVGAIGFGGGCDGANGVQDDAGVVAADGASRADVSRADAGADAGGQQCEPGEIVECTDPNTPGINRCSADGRHIDEGRCPAGQVCRAGGCVEVFCVPGRRRCDDPTHPQVCNDQGSAFDPVDACVGGERCEAGFCLNRCEVAEQTNSYIGCEYWAVELENHLLNDSQDTGEPLPNDARPPFAVVLANTSSTYDAQISVYRGDTQFAQAVASRTVASDTPRPGDEYVTVHSEVVDADGRRIAGPLSGDIDRIGLPRGALMTLVLPFRGVPFGTSSLDQLAYRVESTQPVVAYQFNPLCCNYNFTNDASLLLPSSVLTKNYMYTGFPVARGADGPSPPTLTVVGTKADTEVSITLPAPGTLDGQDQPRPYTDLIYPFAGSRAAGPDESGQISATVQPFEALNVAGAEVDPIGDLTGAVIESNKPVAVFSGHSCTNIPFNLGACDHLESQLFPSETWGQRFVAAPLKIRQQNPAGSREATYWKFLARQNGTDIDVGLSLRAPNVLPPAGEGVARCVEFAESTDAAEAGKFSLDAGQSCAFGTRQLFVAEAANPMLIGAFVSGQKSVGDDADFGSHAGDPAFFLVPPEEQYRTTYSFLTPATYFQSYVTVTAQPGTTVTLDDQQVALDTFDYQENLDRGAVRAHIPVEPGPHAIDSQVPFGIVVYGYDDYVSYAYTGGLNFRKLSSVQ